MASKQLRRRLLLCQIIPVSTNSVNSRAELHNNDIVAGNPEERVVEGSEIDEVASNSTDDSAEEHRRLWTKHVLADISCYGKFLILASQKDILILTAKWSNERLVFTKLWDGMLSDVSETSSEQLTFCLALPLRSKRSSSDGMPDWTCIVYGFKSGYVAFHTDAGYSVHRQQFEVSAVVKIKLRSSPRRVLRVISWSTSKSW